jgi:hypothetical protein
VCDGEDEACGEDEAHNYFTHTTILVEREFFEIVEAGGFRARVRKKDLALIWVC